MPAVGRCSQCPLVAVLFGGWCIGCLTKLADRYGFALERAITPTNRREAA